MKKIATILFAFCLCASLFSQDNDVKFNENQLKALENACPKSAAATPKKERNILIFSKTSGFRHKGGIPAAKVVFRNMGDKLGIWKTTISDDLANFEPENLKKFDCIVLNNSTSICFGPALEQFKKMSKDEQAKVRAASDRICKNIIDYVRNGGGIVAVHAAVDSYNYDIIRNREFTDMLGGEFVAHPWYMSNAPTTMVIDDPDSPLVKGIWEIDGFKVTEEVYMLGSSYDRKKCRVLMRLDPSRSPLTTAARENHTKLRPDGDFATAYVKSFGKGRVAYTTFGHDSNNYFNPKFQELYMRLTQFACGDLEADTSPVPFTDKSVLVPMDEKPSTDKIAKLSDLKYGQERDEEINGILFSTYANNFDRNFRLNVEKFILAELESGNGTIEYRTFLAELLWATQISSKENCKRAEKIAKKSEECLRGKISNAVDHFKKASVVYKKEKQFAVPSQMPADKGEIVRLFKYLAKNPSVAIPSYAKFDSLDDFGRAHLAFALISRGESAAEALKYEPKSEAFAIAYAAALAKDGKASDIEKLVMAGDFISPRMRPVAVGYIVSIKSEDTAKTLLDLVGKAKTTPQSALIVDSLARFELGSLVSKIFAGFAEMSPEMKITTLRTAESIANLNAFEEIAKQLPQLDRKTANAAIRAMLKCASVLYDPKMFDAVSAAYPQCDKFAKANIVRFAAFESSDRAVEFVKKAYSEGFRENAVKALGEWRAQNAFAPLVAIAKSVKDEQGKIIAQQSVADVSKKCGIDGQTLDYMLKNAVREEEKSKAIDSAIKNPSADCAEVLAKNGFSAEAKKIRDALKNVQTKYLSNNNPAGFKFALDGNIATRYSSNTTIKTGDWIAFDFGYPKKVSEIVFNLGSSRNDFPQVFEVSAGMSDAALFKVSPTVTRTKDGFVVLKFQPNFTARFIKLTALKDKPFYWSIHKLEIKH